MLNLFSASADSPRRTASNKINVLWDPETRSESSRRVAPTSSGWHLEHFETAWRFYLIKIISILLPTFPRQHNSTEELKAGSAEVLKCKSSKVQKCSRLVLLSEPAETGAALRLRCEKNRSAAVKIRRLLRGRLNNLLFYYIIFQKQVIICYNLS